MLEIDVPTEESFDEKQCKIVTTKSFRVRLEHSLVSVSKWEALWKTPFLANDKKTPQQTISYIKFMILNDELSPEVFYKLCEDYVHEIEEYIVDEMTATKLYTDPNAPRSRETITSELVYYWMIALNIPWEAQHWHFNRLITLIRTVNLKNSPKRKMSLAERRALNKSRLAKYNTKG